jgi:hypothetical protein
LSAINPRNIMLLYTTLLRPSKGDNKVIRINRPESNNRELVIAEVVGLLKS